MPAGIPVILVSHGPFAQGALTCAEMLVGKQTHVAVVSIQEDTPIDNARTSLRETYQSLNQGNGVLILVDMMGGSPCNLASELLLTQDDIFLFCGFNIPTLLEIFNNRDLPLNEIATLVEEMFPDSGFNVGNLLKVERESSTEL
ncbi:PTS sugar transporter subunit IIA [Cedecea sp. P7760]|uniref:PTS sugar transporter subunit IIA n=1 Tax=Cedecea sp. P7760 TaxID=2726983 RepID=UPI00159FC65D|nr:PTS sugar transporter subunit IIA [Cedecea sp. P7760]NWC64808.1 PTS sugar transporter subunit IIA [Cedecea sp. P7760]